jgi:hypothetical protein
VRILLTLVIVSSGCSLIAAGAGGYAPTPRSPGQPAECGTHVPQVLDDIVGGLGLVSGSVVVISDASRPSEFQGLASIVIGIPALLIGGIATASAVYGSHKNDACEATVAEQAAEHRDELDEDRKAETAARKRAADDETYRACVLEQIEIDGKVDAEPDSNAKATLLATRPACTAPGSVVTPAETPPP